MFFPALRPQATAIITVVDDGDVLCAATAVRRFVQKGHTRGVRLWKRRPREVFPPNPYWCAVKRLLAHQPITQVNRLNTAVWACPAGCAGGGLAGDALPDGDDSTKWPASRVMKDDGGLLAQFQSEIDATKVCVYIILLTPF